MKCISAPSVPCDDDMLFACVFSSFYQNYLTSKGKSWRDLLQEALRSLQQGHYHPTGELLDQNQSHFYYQVAVISTNVGYLYLTWLFLSMQLSISNPLHLRGKYCTFYITTITWVTSQIKILVYTTHKELTKFDIFLMN